MGSVLAIVTAVIGLLQSLGSVTSSSTEIGKVITFLENLLPALVGEATAVIPAIQDFISTLRGSGVVTQEQLAQLDALSASYDAAFDAQAKADGLDT